MLDETKTVYMYTSNGIYSKTLILDKTDKSPISGTWQIPANCTEVKPLDKKDNYNICWDGTAWKYECVQQTSTQNNNINVSETTMFSIIDL